MPEPISVTLSRGERPLLGPYRILRRLGEGSMGEVYLAEDPRAGRHVAIKVLSPRHAAEPEFLSRFHREADALGRLHHENIVRAWSVGEDRGRHFFVMELCEGVPLDRRLRQDGPLPPREACRIAIQAARGLLYAHEHGIVHRDIKPGNIVLLADGTAKIFDLGLSKSLVETAGAAFRTGSGATLGTPYYMSPEQARGMSAVDGRSDIYSLGATLYHLVTGEPPFTGSDVFEVVARHLSDKVPDPRDLREDVPEGIVHVIRRMMAKDPGDRYPDCKALLDDLEQVMEDRPPKTQPIEVLRTVLAPPRLTRRQARFKARLSRRRSRRTTIVLLGGLLPVAILVLILAARRPAAPAGHDASPGAPAASVMQRPARPSDAPAPPGATPPRRGEDAPSAAEATGSTGRSMKSIREEAARRQLDDILALERDGEIPHDALLARVEGFSSSYADTQAGRDAHDLLDRLQARTAPADAPSPETALPPEAWAAAVATLPPDVQVQRVVERLRRLNPGYDGTASPIIRDGRVEELALPAQHVTDLSPVTALVHLRVLACAGRWDETTQQLTRGHLEDLGPLRDTALRSLDVSGTLVTDLSPLRSLRLTHLDCSHNSIRDLGPLRWMPLQEIRCRRTAVADLSPLKGLPIKSIWFEVDPARDAAVLKTLPMLATINGEPAAGFLAAAAVSPPASVPTVSTPPADGWTPIFNGSDLTGWEKVGGPIARVEEGAIELDGSEIRRPVAAADFELKGQIRLMRGTASYQCAGISVRRPGEERSFPSLLFQTDGDAQLWGEGRRLEARSGVGLLPVGEWIPFHLRVAGDTISLHVAGKPALEGTAGRSEAGFLALYAAESGCVVAFKDLRLKRIE
jgi:hypothetical protein